MNFENALKQSANRALKDTYVSAYQLKKGVIIRQKLADIELRLSKEGFEEAEVTIHHGDKFLDVFVDEAKFKADDSWRVRYEMQSDNGAFKLVYKSTEQGPKWSAS